MPAFNEKIILPRLDIAADLTEVMRFPASSGGGSDYDIKIYRRQFGAADDQLLWAVNATWSNSTSMWTQDAASSPSMLIRIAQPASGMVFSLEGRIQGAGTWAADAWDKNITLHGATFLAAGLQRGIETQGFLRFTNTSGGSLGTNPSSSVGKSNTVLPLNIIKAWGVVHSSSGSFTLTDGFNITSVSDTGTDGRVFLANNMDDTNYAVVHANSLSTGSSYVSAAGNKTVGSFDLRTWESSNPLSLPAGGGTSWQTHFMVLGRQTT